MSVKKKSAAKARARTRRSYSPAFRDEVPTLAEFEGVSDAAREPEIDSAPIHNWHRVHRVKRFRSELERRQAAEIARLERESAEREEELDILGSRRSVAPMVDAG